MVLSKYLWQIFIEPGSFRETSFSRVLFGLNSLCTVGTLTGFLSQCDLRLGIVSVWLGNCCILSSILVGTDVDKSSTCFDQRWTGDILVTIRDATGDRLKGYRFVAISRLNWQSIQRLGYAVFWGDQSWHSVFLAFPTNLQYGLKCHWNWLVNVDLAIFL